MNWNINSCDGIYNSFDVHFTSECDNRCPHCIDAQYSGKGIKHPDAHAIAKAIIDHQEGFDDVLFLGGEPCLYLPELCDCIRMIKAETVLQCFCQAAVEKMTEGFAIQLLNGNDVAMRIFPDLHIKGGNINLKRAKELMPDEVTDEQSMVDHAGDLIDRAGVKVSVRAVVQQKFTDLLDKEGYQLKRTGIVTKQYNPAEDGGDNTNTGGGNTGGSDDDNLEG